MPPKVSDENPAVRRDAVVRVPARTFVLGDAISATVTVTWGRLVPLPGQSPAMFWVRGERDALGRFERRAVDDDTVGSLTPVATAGRSTLYRVEWASSAPLSKAVDASDVAVQRVESRAEEEEWRIQLLSLDPRSLSVFGEQCVDRDIPFTVDRLSPTYPPDENARTGLTNAQKEAIRTACERGYFDIPRKTTLDELGSELGISRQAVSFRLRRGIRRLVGETFSVSDCRAVE